MRRFKKPNNRSSIKRQVTLPFEFGLPSPPWMELHVQSNVARTMTRRTARRRTIATACVVVVIGIPTVSMLEWMRSQPYWEITLHNSPGGAKIEVFESNATQSTYDLTIAGVTLAEEIHRIRRPELPAEVGVTTFYDETIRPGRWTFVVGGREIDVMERALILDGKTEIQPQRSH